MVADIDRVNADLKNNYGEAAIDFLVTIPRKILKKILCKKNELCYNEITFFKLLPEMKTLQ